MARLRAEWLVLPLFLLPALVGVALCLYARSSYFAELDGARRLGRQRVEAWLRQPGEAASWVREFEADHAPVPGDVPVGERTYVRLRAGHALGDAPWTLSDAYPGGLPASTLANEDVRVALESGHPAASFAQLDPGARLFLRLLRAPDLDALRRAALPAGTKLFLVRRWRQERSTPELAGAERLLAMLVAAGPGLASLPAGVFRRGGVPLVRARVLLIGVEPRRAYVRPLSEVFRLRYSAGTPAVWEGTLDEPLAGRWSLEAIHGDRWWRVPGFARWAGPVAALLAASLLLPVGLFLAVRRRRLLDEARARFLTELAHDLRTPLTSVRLHAELLAAGRAREPERNAAVLAREAARLSALLANLLDLSRLERGTRAFVCKPVAVRAAVEESVRDFAALYPDRGDDVRITGGDDERVLADRTALERCLANLLDNAGKFTPPGTAIEIAWNAANGKVVLRVADQGPGVARADRRALFARYRRGRRAARDGVPGTGLGLALVRELAKGMGGRVAYRPTGQGACFELELARAES